jgi:hypothetical protein
MTATAFDHSDLTPATTGATRRVASLEPGRGFVASPPIPP